ncbi:TPA: hypothetical protein JBB11_13535 [Legionella pneumophila subsp. pneumophila]|nr:hypothetical protein [Legionella pneumophila subsp. pneumophila]HAT8890232.1 hypothetical protein [Legionella pneumophila subsp. pneumophila]HAT8934296.1 hypothetical protein [Legionella pneumophila subsp. pneumophila]
MRLWINEGYYGYWSTSTYGGVEQKWLLAKSTKAKAREENTLNKAIAKSTEAALKSFHRLCRKTFDCATDAEIALQE